MAVYGKRNEPAYAAWNAKPEFLQNPHILKWWNADLDNLLRKQIDEFRWTWPWQIRNAIEAVTPISVIEEWKRTDPTCRRYARSNVLMYFAIARADALGLTAGIRPSQTRTCPICQNRFREDSLAQPLIRRLGVDQIDHCAPCVESATFSQATRVTQREEVLEWVKTLTSILGRVPAQDFGAGLTDLLDLPTEERTLALRHLLSKPARECVSELFGSWLKVLVDAGVLDDDVQKMARGYRCLARDGHVCLSLGKRLLTIF